MSTAIVPPYRLVLASSTAEQFALQDYIQRAYQREFNAEIPHFLPLLVGLERADGSLAGACGLTLAADAPLYLENYLDLPVELSISERLARPVLRERIVEIGNFACAEAGHARIMFAALCRWLSEQSFDYVVFTGTAKLRNSFHRLHLNPLELAPALPERVGKDANAWGHYYQCQPRVMVGDLAEGRTILASNTLLLGLFDSMPALFPHARRAHP